MRLIDADDLMQAFEKFEFCSDMGDAMEILDNAPTIEERPKGHWVISKDGTYPICSVCITRGETQYNGLEPIPKCSNFCSNCGAKMIKEDDTNA